MSQREAADDYTAVVAKLNQNWRVITCRDGIQWILQHRGSPKKSRKDDWRGRWYCRTSEALLRGTRAYAGSIDSQAMLLLMKLPDRIEELGQADAGFGSKPYASVMP